MLFPVMYIGAAIVMRVRPRRASEIDFVTGLKEIEEVSYDDEPPKNIMERFWSWLVRCVYYRLSSRSLIDY